jgi:putative transposase
MSRMQSPSSGKPYGLARVCWSWRRARANIYRHPEPARQRPGPAGIMPDEALLERNRGVLSDSPFHGEGHRKIWARLRIVGVRTALRRVLRLMRENAAPLAPGRVGQPCGPRNHDRTIQGVGMEKLLRPPLLKHTKPRRGNALRV